METNLFFFKGFRGSVWHPKCDHGRLVGEVRGQDDRDKWKQTFFSRDSEAAFGTQSATMGAGFGPELDWEKLWRDQVSGAKMTETNRNKLVFFLGIQRQPLGPKVRPWEAGFGSESDWEKLWRDQVSGAKMTETNRNSARTCRQQTLSLLDAARTHASLEPQPIALLRRSTNLQATDAATAPCCSNTCISGTASYSNIRTPLAVAHNVAVVLPEALTEPEAGVGTESVTMGGWRVVLEQT